MHSGDYEEIAYREQLRCGLHSGIETADAAGFIVALILAACVIAALLLFRCCR